MVREFYNKLECNKLVGIINSDPQQAKIGFQKYLEIYPEDFYAWCVYASVLVTLQEFELAKKILDETECRISRNSFLTHKVEKKRLSEKDILYSRVRLLSYTGQYDKLYEYVFQYPSLLAKMDLFKILSVYCQKKLGILKLSRDDVKSYLFKQIVEYRESDMLEHIKDHLADYSVSMEIPDLNVFVPDFPLDEVLQEIKKIIPSEKKLCFGIIDNTYVFRYDGCGRDNNRLTDYFKVICFHDSQDIITMCPVFGSENLPYFDLNYLNQNINAPSSKVKTISQREKFKRRYGKI